MPRAIDFLINYYERNVRGLRRNEDYPTHLAVSDDLFNDYEDELAPHERFGVLRDDHIDLLFRDLRLLNWSDRPGYHVHGHIRLGQVEDPWRNERQAVPPDEEAYDVDFT